MTAELKTLPAVLGFDDADLDANRRGQLSQSQIERMRRSRQRATRVAASLFLGLALGATLLFYIGQLQGSLILHGLGAMLIAINAIMIGMTGRTYMRVAGDLRAGEAEALAGEVERVLRRGRALDSYLLRINGAEFSVTKDVFMVFRHEAPYRVYRASFSRQMLSAEPGR